MTQPSRFYRYRSIKGDEARERVRRTVVEREAHYSSLTALNDPFEGCVRISLEWGTPQQWRDRFQVPHPPDPALVPEFERMGEKRAREAASEFGLFCVSEERDNVLMWSHYADRHAGICLEFASTADFLGAAEKMPYPDEYPTLYYLEGKSTDHSRVILLSKAKHWEYEREWRLFAPQPGLGTYPAGCLTGVILGCEISPDDEREVAGWIEEAADDIVLYKASRNQSEYAIDVAPVEQE